MDKIKRELWISENGKYKVLVRHFAGDPSPMIGYWKLKGEKFGPVKYSCLPGYVLNQIEVMRSRVMFQRK